MRRSQVFGLGLGAGLLVTVPFMAILYLAEQVAGLPFVPYDLFDWLARVLPGDVVIRGIHAMVDVITYFDLGETSSTAKTLETLAALAAFLAGGVIAGALLFLALARFQPRWRLGTLLRYAPGVLGGLVIGLPVILISHEVNITTELSRTARAVGLALAFGGWGGVIAHLRLALVGGPGITESVPESILVVAEAINRREFLIRAGSAAAVLTVFGAGLGRYLAYKEDQDYRALIARRRADAEAVADNLPNADDPVTPAPGTRPELTPLEDHYRIDINIRPADLDSTTWRLRIGGMVDQPLELTLDDLQQRYAPLNQYVTLSCISNAVGGQLISTVQWTGARLTDVLADAGVSAGARYAHFRSADGFYETLDLALLDEDDRIMLCYAWEGIPLLHDHGYPLRLYIPDRYGMKQPKWITDIEITDEYREGYWVERGWDEVARMQATSVIDVAASDHIFERDGVLLVPIGGIAHAGARGVSRVQVRVDQGEWIDAQLRAPLSETTWVIWRYDWPFSEGRHMLQVRCTEDDGTPQIEEDNPLYPSGATGIHGFTQRF